MTEEELQQTHCTITDSDLDTVFTHTKAEALLFLLLCRCQFASDGADIGFGVYRRTKEGGQKVADMLQVLPSERYNAHLVPEDSWLSLPEAGVCECSTHTATL